MNEEELFFNGFCRAQNQGRMVCACFETENGECRCVDCDCAYPKCTHKAACEIAKQIREKEES